MALNMVSTHGLGGLGSWAVCSWLPAGHAKGGWEWSEGDDLGKASNVVNCGGVFSAVVSLIHGCRSSLSAEEPIRRVDVSAWPKVDFAIEPLDVAVYHQHCAGAEKVCYGQSWSCSS